MYKLNRIDPKTDPAVYAEMETRFTDYLKIVNDPSTKPVRVFNPFPERLLKELELVREASETMKQKKEEDMRKAAALKEEQAREAAEAKESAQEEGSEEKAEEGSEQKEGSEDTKKE